MTRHFRNALAVILLSVTATAGEVADLRAQLATMQATLEGLTGGKKAK